MFHAGPTLVPSPRVRTFTLLSTAYVAAAFDTTEAVITDCLNLDDLWEDDGTGTAALPADAIALIAVRLDAWPR
ncbi:hypothetical protein DEI81_08350 [Curtobacterium sp. MCBD17_013]|uniref:hypothetical protein n=1 Tax=Curtobacterium sp. MCBD17_013 TaxID=2175668 RepID=UPI000DA6FB87|nr:hypothetical protein [Curtobacterium sp. MCBD17_013]PZF62959.1 hypothetical protein DEI81_08350 [Curtobacterium sp. MCBD17_013]